MCALRDLKYNEVKRESCMEISRFVGIFFGPHRGILFKTREKAKNPVVFSTCLTEILLHVTLNSQSNSTSESSFFDYACNSDPPRGLLISLFISAQNSCLWIYTWWKVELFIYPSLLKFWLIMSPICSNLLPHCLLTFSDITILEVGHPGIWSRDINFWGTVLGIYLHFLRKIRFCNLMSRTY